MHSDNFFCNLNLINLPYDKFFNDYTLYSELIRKKIINKSDDSVISVKSSIERKKILERVKSDKIKITKFDFLFDFEKKKIPIIFYRFFKICLSSLYNLLFLEVNI